MFSLYIVVRIYWLIVVLGISLDKMDFDAGFR